MNKKNLWRTVLENLKVSLSSANFATWFPQTFITQIKKIDKNRQIVEIGCPSGFVRDTIENRYYGHGLILFSTPLLFLRPTKWLMQQQQQLPNLQVKLITLFFYMGELGLVKLI